jgi:outer membrane protein
MRFLPVFFIAILLPQFRAAAQTIAENTDVWPLERCVQYAVEHNISIKQNALNATQAKYALLQSQLSQLPSVNINSSYGKSFGRSINPATNLFVDASYNFLNASANSNVLLFGWMQMRNTIERNKLQRDAAIADLDQLTDQVSLNVANSFLAALLAKEQVSVSENQVQVSKAQLAQTRAFAAAGRLPELNVAQLESQLATDSSNLINSIANYNAAVLDLKALLNLDFAVPFSIQKPVVDANEQMMAAVMQPEEIYQQARTHLGSVKASMLRVSAAEKNVAAAKGGLYPQLSLGYQMGTTFASNYYNYKPSDVISRFAPIGIIDTTYVTPVVVYQPVYDVKSQPVPFFDQLSNNIRQSVFLSLNVPVFNGWQSQYALRQAKINLASQQLNEYNAELTLKQDVYKAHNNVLNAIQKYHAAKRADEAAKRALDFATKRYDLGLTSTVDLLVTQNSAFVAAANAISSKYELIFRLKVIDYYLGKPLKL